MRSMDLFFFYGSTYTYLTVMRIEKLAVAAGIAIRWRPFNVRQIMIEMENIPFAKKPIKAKYMWRDIERRAKRHGIAFKGSPVYPVDPQLLATRVGVIAADDGWCPEYTKATYRAWFLENKGAGLEGNVEAVLESLGKNAAGIVARAKEPAIADRLDEETNVARSLGIFGSPTFVVDGEIFWGDDRLEDAIEWRLEN